MRSGAFFCAPRASLASPDFSRRVGRADNANQVSTVGKHCRCPDVEPTRTERRPTAMRFLSQGGRIQPNALTSTGYPLEAAGGRDVVVSKIECTFRWAAAPDLPLTSLRRRHLFSGDVALSFARGSESLLLRQVYPAGIAVQRRPLERWLRLPPFTERRRPPREALETERFRGFDGLLRRGWRRLPSPMGWCSPRFATAIAVVDRERDRLLISELLTKREHCADLVRRSISEMNSW